MHLLSTSATMLDDMVVPVDLGQPPGDMVVLSFADSDLTALAAAWAADRTMLPSIRLAHLRDLRHPMSIDLWIDRVGRHARVIVVRLLGGLDWWRYGVEQLSALARAHAIVLAVLPGEDHDDPRLAEASTLPADELERLLGYFREGGRDNLRSLLRRLARHAGAPATIAEPVPIPRTGAYLPDGGIVSLDRLIATLAPDRPRVPVLFYRSLLLAGDVAPVDALVAALAGRGLDAAPLFVPSLKDAGAAAFVRAALARLRPAVIVTTTAFAAAGGPDAQSVLDGIGAPVLQVVIATTKRAAWRESPRGLGASDLAMHVVLPELDGRVLAGAVAFKDPLPTDDGLAFTALANRPEPDRIDLVADRVAALVRLQRMPRAQRRVAVLVPDYPGAPGRTGYAVGLDVPASVIALLGDLADAGYGIDVPPPEQNPSAQRIPRSRHAVPSPPGREGQGEGAPQAPGSPKPLTPALSPTGRGSSAIDSPEWLRRLTPRTLLDALDAGDPGATLSLEAYGQLLATVPPDAVSRMRGAWGEPHADPDVAAGAFRFRARRFGNVLVAIAPDRGRAPDRRADYHDAALPPRHALIAFGLWLRHVLDIDALVHMGAHGAVEWLPGKAVALTGACFPEIWSGPLPVFYPFIVSNPGEAAQAKRRLAAVTIGHLPPPLAPGELSGETRELERLVDEYAQADGLDGRRRERLARLVIDTAHRTGLAREAGAEADLGPDEALRRIDAWLCDLKDLRAKDGFHVYGRAPATGDPAWLASAEAERTALVSALDGRRVAPGPAGAPARERHDVLPTGRNLYTADPRMIPTPTAADLGRLAADEVIRDYLQRHGEMPRALVVDLWGSASLRTAGEEIAQGLALMGCRPIWDRATGRVTGVEVLPCAVTGRSRVDVTWRISGLFRDLFPAQIALIDAAVRAVAARDETDGENPLAAARRASGGDSVAAPARIFGTAPDAYGAGVDDLLEREMDPGAMGEAYLAAASHAYGGAEGDGVPLPGAFTERVATADLLLHPGDDPGRDLLEGSADVSFVGGFAAAAARLGRRPDIVVLDTTDPRRPRARSLPAALGRIVRARAVNPRYVEGLLQHGPRGAAELAETVDRLIAFAELTDSVADALIDLVHDAYVADPRVRDFLLRENPAAARAIAERLDGARCRGLWHPRRNDVDAGLAALRREATSW